MRRLVFACVVATSLLTACKEEPVPAKVAPGQEVTLKGALVAGAKCPMIEIKDGRRYSLGGDLGKFKVGDRVCLRGTVAAMSICMAGEATVEIKAIGPENACP